MVKSTRRFKKKRLTYKSNRGKLQKVKAFGHVFSPYCIWCQRMHDDWEALNKVMKTSPYKHIVKEDVGDNHEAEIQALNAKYNVKFESSLGFPTIFRIIEISGNQNALEIYSGERTKTHMLKWITH